jgi:hypothetical protein
MKRFWLRTLAGISVLALGLMVAAPAANASAAGPTILAHIGDLQASTEMWKSTPSHTPDYDYQSCVAIYGYDDGSEPNGDPNPTGGWNISYRYSSSHIAFWSGPKLHHSVNSYCGPWRTDSKSSTYTRVTAFADSYILEADVWQYWN